MAQINVKKTNTFQAPPLGCLAYAFDSLGNPGVVDASGTFIPLVFSDASPSNIVANLGVGLGSALPENPEQGDIYVGSDTNTVYTCVDGINWNLGPLIPTQFVTDIPNGVLYQYKEGGLIALSVSMHNALGGRSEANTHPIASITGLSDIINGDTLALGSSLIDFTLPNKQFTKTVSNTVFTGVYKANVGKALRLTGVSTFEFPAFWKNIPSQYNYDGTKTNKYVLVCWDATTGYEEVTYQLVAQY